MTSARDRRLYIQLALDFLDNPKVKPLSDKAVRALLEMFLYSAKHGLDGKFSPLTFKTFGTASARKELLTNHSERPSVFEQDGAFCLHDYELHNRTVAQIEALSAVRSTSGKQRGKSQQVAEQTWSNETANDPPYNNDQIAKDIANQSQGGPYVGTGIGGEPPSKCPTHTGVDNPPNCGQCADARKAHDRWLLSNPPLDPPMLSGLVTPDACIHEYPIGACPYCEDPA